MSMDVATGKRSAALEASAYVEDGMTLGIGTGSTAAFFIDALGAKIEQGFRLRGVPTSDETEALARKAGVEIIEPDSETRIDLAVDGADEVDPRLNLIKGGGGALLREKIVARAANRFIVIADGSKRVDRLGDFPLPIEIEAFGKALTIAEIRDAAATLGLEKREVQLRAGRDGAFLTDGGNLIVDCALGPIADPAKLEARLRQIPGVIECGLFCAMADMVIFGDGDQTEIVHR